MKAVLFDFGNVLYTFDYNRFFRAVAHSSAMTADELHEWVFGGQPSRAVQFETGRMSPSGFLSEFQAAAGITLTHREIEALFLDIFIPNEPVLELVRDLAAETKIGLVSNTNELHFQGYMRHIPVFPLFSAVALSYIVGAMKPDPRMYESALQQLGRPAEECIFIDDLRENVVAAEGLGFSTIHYRVGMDLRAALARV
jgi:glucose-1-phosphatase